MSIELHPRVGNGVAVQDGEGARRGVSGGRRRPQKVRRRLHLCHQPGALLGVPRLVRLCQLQAVDESIQGR